MIVVVCCIALLLVIAFPITRRARQQIYLNYDQVQITKIHMAWTGYVKSDWRYFPVPGLIDRRETDRYEVDTRPVGPWLDSRNTTAKLFATLVAQDYFSPGLLISPRERSPFVVVDDDYDYTMYKPKQGVFWDSAFVADLQSGSNVSYAHLPMVGMDRIRRWRSGADRSVAHLGNRGPGAGTANAQSYSCQTNGSWIGNVIFGDGHQELFDFNAGAKITVSSTSTDNPFHINGDLDVAEDQVIAFTEQIVDAQPILQHD